MDLYFDEVNLKAFIGRVGDPLHDECLNTVRKLLNVKFNFTKDRLAQDPDLLAWYTTNLTSGIGTSDKYFLEDQFPERPLKSNSYISFDMEQLSAIYLIDDERVEIFKEAHAVLCGAPGECLETISTTFLKNNDYRFERTLLIKGRSDSPEKNIDDSVLKQWNDLSTFDLPLTDIVIFDQFALKQPDLIDYNLIPMVTALVNNVAAKVNVIIYTSTKEAFVDHVELDKVIKKAVSNITGKKCTFTLIRVTSQRGVRSKAEHDRCIITNYGRYRSGDSFAYWKEDGTRFNTGRDLSISSLAHPETHDQFRQLIEDIQSNIDGLSDSNIEGDKISNFFTFS